MSDPSVYGRPARQSREVDGPAGTVYMDDKPRCNGTFRGRPCNKLLAEFVSRPWGIKCSRCGTKNVQNVPPPLVA